MVALSAVPLVLKLLSQLAFSVLLFVVALALVDEYIIHRQCYHYLKRPTQAQDQRTENVANDCQNYVFFWTFLFFYFLLIIVADVGRTNVIN
jgi:ABC-type Fe3+ transport system permease subunit